MSKILGTDKTSVCVYCNQQAYGSGCAYSPSKIHLHMDDPKRCIYCGQMAVGSGCPYSPVGNIHIHGVEFNLMMKEGAERGLMASILINRMSQPIAEMSAFKLGLIDEQANVIQSPSTDEERAALTPIDFYVLKLRKLIGEDKLQLMNTTVLIEKLSKPLEEEAFDSKMYEAEVELKEQISMLAKDYKKILMEAFDRSISVEKVENMLFEEIIDD